MAANTLTPEQKFFIVRCLASIMTPSQTAAAVKEQFGIKVTRQAVQAYDPDTVAGRALSEDLVTLFREEREAYIADVRAIPLASRGARIRELQRIYQRAVDQGNDVSARSTLEQIAKEEGGAFTNRRELTGAGGGPVEFITADQMAASQIAAKARAEEFEHGLVSDAE